MRNDKEHPNTHSLPAYLAELLRPTPSGVAKLIAAWDGLSTESKIQILTELPKLQLSPHLHEKVCTKALDSKNPYVRYLAAKQAKQFSVDEGKAIKKRIEEDSAPLVRYCLLENNCIVYDGDLRDPETFFRLSQEARLAKVRCLEGGGEEIANLISYAADHQLKDGTVSETELFEILTDYLNNFEFAAHYRSDELSYDGYGEYLKGKDIEALWHLVPKLPLWVSIVLIKTLPPSAGLNSNILERVVSEMTDVQLEFLLYRRDIGLKEFRKRIFLEGDRKRNNVRGAAVYSNFNLTYQEFAQILAKPEKEKIDDLRDLAFAQDLSLCFYEAIHDVSFIIEGLDDWVAECKSSFNQKLSDLHGYERDKELHELRLYRLAKNSVPWKKSEKGYPLSGELEFLAKSIVEGDTWGTFMAFSVAWEKQSGTRKSKTHLEKYLPRIYEIDDLSRDETDTDETGTKTPEDWNATILNQFDKLQASFNRLKLLLYVVVALLILLLIYRR